jgi:hypothetical protein
VAKVRTNAEICWVPTVEKMQPIKWSNTCHGKAWIIAARFDTDTTIALFHIIHEQGCFCTPTLNDVLLYRNGMHVHWCRIWMRVVSEVLVNSLMGIALLKSLNNFVHINSGLA